MPMDGFTLSFLQQELQDTLAGGRVDKVTQPERDTLLLVIRNQGGNHRLLLSANASHARAQLTTQTYENPAQPPMFCMLMRKHLQGAHLEAISQQGGDRILVLHIRSTGELGDATPKTLYLEIMGRHSNLILTDSEGLIIDSIKHVNQDMSRVRTVLPGQPYRLPPQQNKLQPGAFAPAQLTQRLSSLARPLAKALQDTIAGLAHLSSREVCAQLRLDPDTPCNGLQWDALAPSLTSFFASLPARRAPVVLLDDLAQVLDFFPFPYQTYPPENQRAYSSLSQAMDAFFTGRDLRMRMQQRSAGMQKHIRTAIDRLEKKKSILLGTLAESQQSEKNRIFGELLTANLHLVQKGARSISLPNYYNPSLEEVSIPLSIQKTPAQNAQAYYRKYRKAKTAKAHAAQQLEKTEAELFLLENALEDLDKSSSSADLAEIRRLLAENGYLRPTPTDRKQKKTPQGQPYRFTSEDGIEIVVGKNALQNDRLTLHARGEELWLHAQGIPGSHVIVRAEGMPPDATLLLAAKLAVYYSKGRNHPAQAVDYTRRKYVKKAAGGAAGFVTYTHFQTVIIGLSPQDMALIARQSAGEAM